MKNFAEMRTKIKEFRTTLEAAAAVRDTDIKTANELYGGHLRELEIVKANEQYRTVSYSARKDLIAEINDFRAKKLEQLEKSVAKAPNAEQSAKLEELRNRKNLDSDELQIVANSMGDCYGALRSLRDIADAHNQYMSVPDYKDIRADIEDACDYAVEMIDMDKNTYRATEFLGDYQNTIWEIHTEPLDTEVLCSIPKVESRRLTDGEAELLDRVFMNIPTDQISYEVNKAAKSPEMKKLIEMSAVYSTFLSKEE